MNHIRSFDYIPPFVHRFAFLDINFLASSFGQFSRLQETYRMSINIVF